MKIIRYLLNNAYFSCWAGFISFLSASLLEFSFLFRGEKDVYNLLRLAEGYVLFGLAISIVLGLSTSVFSIMLRKYLSRKRLISYYASLFLVIIFIIYSGYYIHLVPLEGIPYYAIKSIICTAGIFVFASFLFLALFFLLTRVFEYFVREKLYPSKVKKWPSILLGLIVLITIGLYYIEPLHIVEAITVQESEFHIEDKPNIILIIVDALRCDHLGCYGYQRNTSPNIDRVAKKGIIFDRAYAQSNWTLPATATLFTSLYPTSHNVLSGKEILSKQSKTLIEDLKLAGYRTAGFSGNPFFWGNFGLRQGFGSFHFGQSNFICKVWPSVIGEISRRLFMPTDEHFMKQAISWIKSNKSQKFFIYLHYMATHAPYCIPKAYEEIYAKEEIPDRVDFPHKRFLRDVEINSVQKKNLIDRYDGAIRFVDDQIGKLFDILHSLDLEEDTLLIIAGDHGEAFGEHGDWTHGYTLYQETIKIPLIIWYAKIRYSHTRSNELAGLIDIKPTISNTVGIKQSEIYQGKDLISQTTKKGDLYQQREGREEIFSEGVSDLKCIITSTNWKLISDKAKGKIELYNLEEDPEEKHNVFNLYPEVAKDLQGRLSSKFEELKKQVLRPAKASISAQTKYELKSLGYLQ